MATHDNPDRKVPDVWPPIDYGTGGTIVSSSGIVGGATSGGSTDTPPVGAETFYILTRSFARITGHGDAIKWRKPISIASMELHTRGGNRIILRSGATLDHR
jgi:hypothetical protein